MIVVEPDRYELLNLLADDPVPTLPAAAFDHLRARLGATHEAIIGRLPRSLAACERVVEARDLAAQGKQLASHTRQ
ncbi:MAG: hypothetical protein JNM75_11995 [Rhodospirillales bacterium]|nr:hypothetical protein [Rhodospirillales bacterium]